MSTNVKFNYDKNLDVLWIILADGLEDRFEDLAPGIRVEYNLNNEIIGYEIINASAFMGTKINRNSSNHAIGEIPLDYTRDASNIYGVSFKSSNQDVPVVFNYD